MTRGILICVALVASAPALAHEGPPYPVLVDQAAPPYTLSVWADPDVGTGTFYVTFDPPARRSDTDPTVSLEVWPATGRLPPAGAEATWQRDGAYVATVPFDREELWDVRVHVTGSAGTVEVPLQVEVTPPGYGRWDLLIYVTPFLLLGGVWVAASVRRRALEQEEE